MFKNTFTKTIFTKRWMALAWAIGILALVVFTLIFYPSLSKSFAESLKDVPESLEAFIGDSSAYRTIAGYTDVQIINQMPFMLIIFGVILFTGLVAGEENEGILQSTLAQPIDRGKIYIQKLLSAMVLLLIVCFGVLFGILIGLVLIGESIGLSRLFEGIFAMWIIVLLFSAFSYALGAATGKRGLSGGLIGAFAFTSLLISSLAPSVSGLRAVDKLSPFHYFGKPGVLQYGINWTHMLILIAAILAAAILGYILFIRRDIYQR